MALTVTASDTSRMLHTALNAIGTVAYGGSIGTVALPVFYDNNEDPAGRTAPWARFVASDMGDIEGNTGLARDGSQAPLVCTVNVTAPAAATLANYFALEIALDAVADALRADQSRAPETGQTQRIHWDMVRIGVDPDPDETTNERTGFVVATGIVSRTTD